MGSKFKELRDELDCLGYKQKLVPECVPLVRKLLLDLNLTTSNLQKYMKIAQQALEERDIIEIGAEPYKCDNGKLIKECNDLHIAFIHFKEQHEKIQRDLRNQISSLQFQLDTCNLEKNKIMSQMQQLEKDKTRKETRTNISKNLPHKKKDSSSIDKTIAATEVDLADLNKKLKDIEKKYTETADDNTVLKNQLKSREEEINRLRSLVEGGRSFEAASKDCCYKNIDSQIVILQDEVTRLKKERNDLQIQLKDALAKQHEAMRRALHLAERNRQLEKEMKDVDEIALAVEAECNNTVKGNSEKVARLQDRINESLILIQSLERDNAKLNAVKSELSTELDKIQLEKVRLVKQLEIEVADKKNLTEKINSFTIIEHDLNMEIDRLSKLSTEQKRRIMELESQLDTTHPIGYRSLSQNKNMEHIDKDGNMSTQKGPSAPLTSKPRKVCKKSSKCKSPTKSRSPTKLDSNSKSENAELTPKCCCGSVNCMKNLRDLLDREVEFRQVHAKQLLEDLKQEKEYYMKEYHRVLEQVKNIPTYEISEIGISQLKQQLKDKDDKIKQLEDELKQLNRTKSNILMGEIQGTCNNIHCRGRERELEIKTRELSHIEIENDTLKAKLQAINETTVFNEERMKKAFKDMEEHIRKLEDERRDLVKIEVTQRSNISHLEDDYRNLKEQMKQTQNDLDNQRANYNQLKLLHEQTDRALSEAQAQAIRAETELASYKSKIKDSNRDTAAQDMEIVRLTSDIQIMKNQLTKLDREKDDLMNNLDEKTEKLVHLEEELNSKNILVAKLENELKELNRKLSKYASDSSSQDQIVRSKQQELNLLEQDYQKEKRLKEAALLENKRLQNDLSSVTCDCRDARNELDICRRQVEDLKRQLQHYVAEVKRTEDLISQKELERNELLDQFRSLSQEANILESNNHTLETEATQSKIQLSVALDHTSELERKLEYHESIVRSYEKQIADLTAHIASLEVQLKQKSLEVEHFNTEMKQMRDLCMKLDKERDNLQNELFNKEDRRSQVQKTSEKLNSEKHALEKALDEEKNNLETVEKLYNEARRETIEQRLLNQELEHEIKRLKQKIGELEERLSTKSETRRKDNTNGIVSNDGMSNIKDKIKRNIGYDLSEDSKNTGILSRKHSLLSTKSLTRTRKFHGSDGVLHGFIDLTKLSENDESMSRPNSAPLDLSKDKAYSSRTSVPSTNTLTTTNKLHGSKGLNDAIDLTKLDQDNMDCDERCDKVKCPLHRKFFSAANSQCEATSCVREHLTNKERVENNPAEICKTVEFDLLENVSKIHDSRINKNVPDKAILASTASLKLADYKKIREASKGKMDLMHLGKECDLSGTKQQTNEQNLNELLPEKFSEAYNTDNDMKKSLCAGLKPVNENTSNGNLCFYNKCSGRSEKFRSRELLEPLKVHESSQSFHSEHIDLYKPIVNAKMNTSKHSLKNVLSMSEPDVQKEMRKSKLQQDKPHISSKFTNNEAPVQDKPSKRDKKQDCGNKSHRTSEYYSSFDQNSDTSAVFRKVFTVEGVGLRCHCCISSFKLTEE